ERHLKYGVVYAEQAFKIERHPGLGLVGVIGQPLGTALGVGGELVCISELKINALLVKPGPQASPIAEQPWGRRNCPLIGWGTGLSQAGRHTKPDDAPATCELPHLPTPAPLARLWQMDIAKSVSRLQQG